MKNYILFFLSIPFLISAQDRNINYKQANDIKFAKNYKNNTTLDSYITKDGLKISVGDILTIGNAFNERDKYMINDKFSNIVIGNVKGTYIHDYKYLPHNYSENKVRVKEIYVKHVKYEGYNVLKNRKETPLYINVYTKTINDDSKNNISNFLRVSKATIINIDDAILSGEIQTERNSITREEAIKKLKESKDLMEIGLISQQEYDELKEKLTPIILNNK